MRELLEKHLAAARVSLLLLASFLPFVGCGDRATCPDPPCENTECETFCLQTKDKIAAMTSATVDCTAAYWVGDCQHCTQVLRERYDLVAEKCPWEPAAPSYCETFCLAARDDIVNNFGLEVDCSDPMWVGDCAYCDQLLRQSYDLQPDFTCPAQTGR